MFIDSNEEETKNKVYFHIVAVSNSLDNRFFRSFIGIRVDFTTLNMLSARFSSHTESLEYDFNQESSLDNTDT